MPRPPRLLTLPIACLLLAAGAPVASATFYASPTGTSGDPCTLAAPCTIAKAVASATALDGDVRLFGGDYPQVTTSVSTVFTTTIGAQPGTGRPVIHVGNSGQLRVFGPSRIADVDIVQDASNNDVLFLSGNGALGERVFVTGTIPGAAVAISATGAGVGLLRDSVVVNHGAGPNDDAVRLECNGCNGNARVANSTLLATGGAALRAFAAGTSGGVASTLDVVNTIANSSGGPDVRAVASGDHAVLNLDHSAWVDEQETGADASINDLGGRVASPVAFVDLAGGDLRLTPGSAAIDAGASAPAWILPLTSDFTTGPRVLGPAVDLGAYESPGAPLVTTGGAPSLAATTVTIAGTLVPNGAAATWRFEFGETTAYGATAGGGPTAGDFAEVALTATLSGLAPATTYHYRLVAQHAYGGTAGTDRTFTTSAAPVVTPPGDGNGTATQPTTQPATPGAVRDKTVLPPLAKACLSVRDFTLQVKGGRTARAIKVTVDGRRATVTRGKQVRARVNLRGTPPKVVVVSIVVTSAKGKKRTTTRRYRTCSRKRAGGNQVRA